MKEIIKPDLEGSINISIIVSAYKTSEYIESCLDSIEAQDYEDDFEILLGIDGCRETFEKYLKIKNKYKKIKAFWFPENNGTYKTSNTLVEKSKYDTIMRFDSDDIMHSNMLQATKNECVKNDTALCTYRSVLFDEAKNTESETWWFSKGQITMSRKLFEVLGGWRDWICNADTELIERAIAYGIKETNIQEILFRKRLHPNALTIHPKTNKSSEIRQKYIDLIEKKFEKVKRETHYCEEILDFKFTKFWGINNRLDWKIHLNHIINAPNKIGLEIGIYEARSVKTWLEEFLTGKNSFLVGIESVQSDNLKHNLKVLNQRNLDLRVHWGDAVEIINSGDIEHLFDFIYIDGPKEGDEIFEIADVAWGYLKKGGYLIFDDYEWKWSNVSVIPSPPKKSPKEGIDNFLKHKQGLFDLKLKNWQVIISKK